MENAGRATSEKMKSVLSKHDQICILVGPGNNGGDGYVIARTLFIQNYNVHVIQIVPDEKIKGDARYHKKLFVNCGGSVKIALTASEVEENIQKADVVVDAMLGIGINGTLREPIDSIVAFVNQATKKVIAIDIPTGLPSDEGMAKFHAIKADYTFIIEAPKVSAFLQHTAPYYGAWETISIGIPSHVFSTVSMKDTWEEEDFKRSLPVRDAFSHKGTHGKGLVVGGNEEMPGSITMSAKAALKAGAGLLTIATHERVIQSIASVCLEATFSLLSKGTSNLSLAKYDAIAVGMGLGRDHNASEVVTEIVTNATCPIIIDADGLYHVKQNMDLVRNRSAATVLTPHPGEMAMLMDCTIEEIVHAPFEHAKKLSQAYGVYVILKGKYTIITTPEGKQTVNHTGNPGLAKGGSGDVLSGIVLSMVMQDQRIGDALCNACYLHGKAADLLVEREHTYYDLLATDIINGLPLVLRT